MESSYDEDLNDNFFFQVLQSDHYDLFNKAIHDGWIICVPRAGSLPKYALCQEDLFSHVLIPSDELPETHFRSLNDKEVKICNRVITVEPNDNSAPFSTHVLFEETFYDSELFKYKVLCIESPLEVYSDFEKDATSSSVNSVQTLRDCIDLLWIESSGKEILEKMDDAIRNFLVVNDKLEYKPLQQQRDLVGSLYANCLQIALQDSRLRTKTSTNKYLFQNIKISVESYVHHGIYKKLIKGITACTAYEDANFNKIVRNLSDLQLRDLDVRIDLYDTVPKAKAQLSRVDGYCTVVGKIGCLQKTVAAISKQESGNKSHGNIITADDLLPMLVFLIIKSGLPNWNAHLTYMKLFNFSLCHSNHVDQNSFLLTSLEAAIEHIKSGLLLGPSEPEGHSNYEEEKCSFIPKSDNAELCSTLEAKINNKVDTKLTSLSKLFDLARQGKDQELKKLLEHSEIMEEDNVNLEMESRSELCHPLCSCDNCERQISQNLCNTAPTIHSCDDRGYTILHVACIHGKPKVVDVLLSFGSLPDTADYSGSTPLHYAASRGHQNALLLLVHSGATVDIADSEGNTPLHLAAGNGHEACVKAIMYFTEHIGVKININRMNRRGETSLHNAARWGYESIVKILLDYGGDPMIENKRKLTPIDYAHSLHISRLLSSFTKKTLSTLKFPVPLNSKDVTVAAATTKTLDFNDEEKLPSSNKSDSGRPIRPRTTDQIRRVERLLRAIAYGDLRLACFYLGLESPLSPPDSVEKTHSCHPLCLCSKTINDDEVEVDSKVSDSVDVNACNSDGFTPLHIAVCHGQIELIQMLLNAGAIINLRTRTKSKTALHIACENKFVQVAQLLLETGHCNVNIQDSFGNTALHYACMSKHNRLVQLLLKFKPNLLIRNNSGKTAQDVAEDKMSLSLVRLLSTASAFNNES